MEQHWTRFPCPNCGKIVQQNWSKCLYCGSDLSAEKEKRASMAQAVPPVELPAAPAAEPPAAVPAQISSPVKPAEEPAPDTAQATPPSKPPVMQPTPVSQTVPQPASSSCASFQTDRCANPAGSSTCSPGGDAL